jgi:hypothetical protein
MAFAALGLTRSPGGLSPACRILAPVLRHPAVRAGLQPGSKGMDLPTIGNSG